jgi:hypothetical protein
MMSLLVISRAWLGSDACTYIFSDSISTWQSSFSHFTYSVCCHEQQDLLTILHIQPRPLPIWMFFMMISIKWCYKVTVKVYLGCVHVDQR